MFIGRAAGGEMGKPVQCLSFEDVVRNFTAEDGGSELIPSLRLFFNNGGSNCYVMRIADDAAAPAKLSLRSEAKDAKPALIVSALAAGLLGNDIRLAVSYNTAQPESTFNLEVFRWQRQSNGTLTRVGLENHLGLSMDPKHPHYVESVVKRDSSLIKVEFPEVPIALGAKSYSQSGYAISAKDDATLQAQVAALLGKGTCFGLSIDGSASVAVDLNANKALKALFEDAGNPMTAVEMETELAKAVNSFLSPDKHVVVTFEAGPAGTAAKDNAATKLLTITRANGEVAVNVSAINDLAVPLMLGTAQGGIEVSRYGVRRPAANGIVSTLDSLISFGALEQDAINVLEINGTEIYLDSAHTLVTTKAAGIDGPKMFQDKSASDYNDGRNGIREKLAIIAAAIVAKRNADPSFEWTAEVWGNRLALIPAGSAGNTETVVVRAGKRAVLPPPVPAALTVVADVLTTEGGNATLKANVRYYALGAAPGAYYTAGVSGNPGGAPGPEHYAGAYKIIDREVDLFNLLVLPSDHDHDEPKQRKLWGPASVFCQQRRAFLLIDPPASWKDFQKATDSTVGVNTLRVGLVKDHSAVLYPRLKIDLDGKETFVGPSGAIAGLCSRIDSTRGVWKAPAGTEADLRGVIGVEIKFSDGENGVLTPRPSTRYACSPTAS